MNQLLLITQNRISDSYGMPCDSLEASYLDYFNSFDIHLFPVPNVGIESLHAYLNILSKSQGLILSGGNDVYPSAYEGEVVQNDSYSKIRNETEQGLLNFAVTNQIPVLGICRGMQFINVYFGGQLIKNLNKHTGEIHHEGRTHALRVIHRETSEYICTDYWEMKSYHRQGVTKSVLAPPLKPFLTSDDADVVEGLFHPRHPIAGFQFHPERESNIPVGAEKLITAFFNKKHFWNKKR